MLKKVIPIVLMLCVICSIHGMAENAASHETPPNGSAERPMQGDFDPSKMPQGDFDPSKMPEDGFVPPQNMGSDSVETSAPNAEEGVVEENPQTSENGENSGKTPNGRAPFGGQMPEGMDGFPGFMQHGQNTTAEQPTGFLGFVKTYSTPIISVVLLGLAYLFVAFYKRKHY